VSGEFVPLGVGGCVGRVVRSDLTLRGNFLALLRLLFFKC
jgi:hypothetical protein